MKFDIMWKEKNAKRNLLLVMTSLMNVYAWTNSDTYKHEDYGLTIIANDQVTSLLIIIW